VPKGKKKKQKQAAYSPPPAPEKRPNWLGEPTFEGRHLSWRFSSADVGGPWPWPDTSSDQLKTIVGRLANFEKMGYRGGIKNVWSIVSVVSLAQSAKQRLRDLERDDIESLHAWHMGAKERLWCAEYNGVMCVLWWDPKHEVYPVPKKHT
jgi:hypothetical protein